MVQLELGASEVLHPSSFSSIASEIMRANENTTLCGDRVILVPYRSVICRFAYTDGLTASEVLMVILTDPSMSR
jgi:hypothetical protein